MQLKANRYNTCGSMAALFFVAGLAPGCKKSAPPPRMIPEVAYQTLQPERVTLSTELPGRTAPFLVAEIRPQVNGLILKRLFQEGSNVRAGQTLYQIDSAPYKATLDQAKAVLVSTEASLPAIQSRAERMKRLVATKAVGQQEADEAEANFQKTLAAVSAAKAAVESARINLGNTPIKAPISGRIGKSNATVGALVTAYQPGSLAIVQQLDPIFVDVTQSSAELLKLRNSLEEKPKKSGARKVKLLLEDGSSYPLDGKFQFQDVTVEPGTGAVTLRLQFPNPRSILLPGMFVRALVEDSIEDQAILAMQQGVSRDAKGNAIAMVLGSDDKVEPRLLVLDRAIGDKWLVKSGLQAGDRLIVEGLQKIRPGMPVKAAPFVQKQASPQPGAAKRP